MKRFTKPGIVVTAILLFTLLVAGCYWTAEEDEGGIILEIRADQIGASQSEEYEGFFFGWVVADDLMRGDEAAAEEAFLEAELAFNQALDAFLATGDPSDFVANLAFPSFQLQVNAFTGSSGSNTFTGLRAEREYLVVVDAYNYANETGGIGFTTAFVDGGNTKTVNLDVGDNYAAFEQFLTDRYGMEVIEEPVEEPVVGPVDVTVSLNPTVGAYSGVLLGTRGSGFNNPPYSIPTNLYFDLIDPDAPGGNLDILSYRNEPTAGQYFLGYYPFNFGDALQSLPLLNPDGSTPGPSPASGNREPLPLDDTIVGVLPDTRVRILVIYEQDRTAIPGSPSIFNTYEVSVVGISDAFTVGVDPTPAIDMYEYRQS